MDTRRKIIHSAISQFMVHGYEKTSLNGIAAELGITKGALYHHFENKAALFREALESLFKELEVWFYENLINAPSFQVLLENYIDFSSFFKNSRFVEDKMVDINLYKLIFDGIDSLEGFREQIAASYKGYIDIVRMRAEEAKTKGEIRQDVDCDVLATMLTTMVEGMILFNTFAPALEIHHRTKEIYENIWKMIGKM